jgi:transcriptional regulator with XRE-family HTH domain
MQRNPLTKENLNRLKYLGTFLRELRVNSGLRQSDVSAAINLSRNSISRIERSHNFSVIHLFELADFYDLPISEIMIDIE